MNLNQKNNILFLLLVLLLSCAEKYIHKPTGIDVHFNVERSMFPVAWRNYEINPHARSLPASLRFEAMDVLHDAFEKYPITVLKKNLEKIYVLKELSFYGIDYGGTNAANVVYLVDNFYSKEFVEKTFHHEFGAVLMHNYNFDSTTFKTFLPDSVSYGNGGLEAIESGQSSLVFDYSFIQKGFLCEYGSSCIEEDFCTITEQLFRPDNEFWEIYEKYSVLHKKIYFIISFYHSIDPVFTEKYFRSFKKREV